MRIKLLFLALTTLMVTAANNLSAQCFSSSDYTFIYDNHTYTVVKNMKSWADAAACAKADGGYLVHLTSQSEQDTIYDAIVNRANVGSTYTTVNDGGGIAYVWIGASDMAVEGTWNWDGDNDSIGTNFWTGEGSAGANNGSVVAGAYNNWGRTGTTPNEPDDFQNNQDAAAIALAGWPAFQPGLLGSVNQWNDIAATNTLYYVIEKNCVSTSSSITDSSCSTYTTPSGKVLTITQIYIDTIPNSAGCDSLITIDYHRLTSVFPVIIQQGNSLVALTSADSIQWVDCDNNFAPLAGATNDTLNPTQDGSYAYLVGTGDCRKQSSCLTFAALGLDKLQVGKEVNVYPNPSSGAFNIEISENRKVESIKCFGQSGRAIALNHNVQGEHVSIELEANAGHYILRIDFKDGGAESFGLVKQ